MNSDINSPGGPDEDALSEAERVQRDAARLGFDWPDAGGVLAKVDEEAGEIREALARGEVEEAQAELGDLLFSVINLARFLDASPNTALRAATAKFERRFAEVKQRAGASGQALHGCGLEELDAHWDAVKASEKERGGGLDRGPVRGAHCPPRNG